MITMVTRIPTYRETRNNMPDRYVRPPQPVEAYQLTASSSAAESIAAWCGGEVLKETKPGDPTDVSIRVKIPGLDGPLIAVAREWVVRDDKTGRFSVWSNEQFSSEYQKVGIR